MSATTKPLKAYQVDHYEEGSVIVFARHNVVARREGANELNTDFDGVAFCRRAPQFDHYAPGPVPISAMIEAGWWWTCSCRDCGTQVTEDFDYVVRGDRVFCDATCDARQAAYERRRAAAEAAMVEVVHAHFPGCHVLDVRVWDDELKAHDPNDRFSIATWASFTFPGSTFPATYYFGDGGLAAVYPDDIATFKALYR
jgi:hypothetical protein